MVELKDDKKVFHKSIINDIFSYFIYNLKIFLENEERGGGGGFFFQCN